MRPLSAQVFVHLRPASDVRSSEKRAHLRANFSGNTKMCTENSDLLSRCPARQFSQQILRVSERFKGLFSAIVQSLQKSVECLYVNIDWILVVLLLQSLFS